MQCSRPNGNKQKRNDQNLLPLILFSACNSDSDAPIQASQKWKKTAVDEVPTTELVEQQAEVQLAADPLDVDFGAFDDDAFAGFGDFDDEGTGGDDI